MEVFKEYQAGLKDLDGFSHIILLYYSTAVMGLPCSSCPSWTPKSGVFLPPRAPKRPNPIGLSVVALSGIKDGVLRLQNVDILNGTPLLDIKPYVPDFDHCTDVRTGWPEKAKDTVATIRSDDRFK